jgi:large subunit ribosomal protein L11
LTIEQVLRIAKIKRHELLAKTLEGAVKEVLGSCISMGVTVEGKDPREIQAEIDEGKYDEVFSKSEG